MTPSLSPSQLAQLKALIVATPALNALPMDDDAANQIAAALNGARSPDYWVWRSSVTRDEYVNGVSVDATTFTWGGATGGFIARSDGERDAWREMFNNRTLAVNPSQANIRTAFNDIFSGTGAGAVANRAHLAAISRRKASIVEHLFRTNAANGASATPDNMGPEGPLIASEVTSARSLP